MMRILKNLSISRKFAVLIGVIAVGFGIYGVVSYTTLSLVKVNGPLYHTIVEGKDLVADILPPPEYIIETYLVAHQMSLPMDNATLQASVDKLAQLEKDYTTRHEFWQSTLAENETKRTLVEQSYTPAREFYRVLNAEYVPAVRRGDHARVRELLDGRLKSLYEEHRKAIDHVVELSTAMCAAKEEEVAGIVETRTAVLISMAVGVVGVVVLLGVVFSRLIGNPIRALAGAADRLAAGDIDVQIPPATQDEVGRLAASFECMAEGIRQQSVAMQRIAAGDLSCTVAERSEKDVLSRALNQAIVSLKRLVGETQRLTQAALDGELSTRGDAKNFEGGYRQVVESVNATLDAVLGPLNVAAEYVERIARGDIPAKITDTYRGDFNAIKDNLNQCVDAVDVLVADTRALAQAAVEGTLSARADATKHRGDFRAIVQGVNDTLDAVIGPLTMTAGCVDRISKGDIPEKITADYRGDFNAIKNNLNRCIEAIGLLVRDSRKLAVATVDGQLDVRADASRHQGDFRAIVQGMNDSLDALIGPLTRTIEHLEHLSHGVIDPDITRDYKGDYIRLKSSFNLAFAAVNRLVADVSKLSDAAVHGRLSVRADARQHEGDFQRIVMGVNATLDAVIQPVNDGAQVLAGMATGDLRVRMNGEYHGDHRKLKESINKVATSLDEALRQVADAVSATASASSQISASTEQMAAGASEQSSQAGEVASAVEEMTKTIQENAQNASQTAAVAKQAKQAAEGGGRIVDQTVDGMKRIAAVVGRSAETVKELGRSSDQIGEIVTVIDDIADQTNLLALNAAIEAARAGEQGRGFAVVADEVRKLAERTTKATKEIAGMIKKIQADTGGAVASMEEGTTQVEAGIALADKAGHSLEEIVHISQKVTDMVTQIAAASEQQSSASEQISKNVEAISTVTNETASGTQQIAKTATDLSGLTERLQGLVEQFKITSDRDGGHKVEGRSPVAVKSDGHLVMAKSQK